MKCEHRPHSPAHPHPSTHIHNKFHTMPYFPVRGLLYSITISTLNINNAILSTGGDNPPSNLHLPCPLTHPHYSPSDQFTTAFVPIHKYLLPSSPEWSSPPSSPQHTSTLHTLHTLHTLPDTISAPAKMSSRPSPAHLAVPRSADHDLERGVELDNIPITHPSRSTTHPPLRPVAAGDPNFVNVDLENDSNRSQQQDEDKEPRTLYNILFPKHGCVRQYRQAIWFWLAIVVFVAVVLVVIAVFGIKSTKAHGDPHKVKLAQDASKPLPRIPGRW